MRVTVVAVLSPSFVRYRSAVRQLSSGVRLPIMREESSDVASACVRQLSFLVTRFGFEQAEVRQIGRETYIAFHRGDSTVSIAWEPGQSPIVEIFEPPHSPDDKITPWAERRGVSRSRRFPIIRVETKFNPTDESQLDSYFEEIGRQLQNDKSVRGAI